MRIGFIALVLALKVLCSPVHPRDLVGLFGDDDTTYATYATTSPAMVETSIATTRSSLHTSSTTPAATLTTTSLATHSIIGQLPIPTATMPHSSSTTATSSSADAEPTVSISYTPEASSTPPDEATEWKVIGIGIMSITFVGTLILLIVFFDSWWGFLRDLVVGKKRQEGIEDLAEGEGKKDWEKKLANEDGHRYPTLTSLESITKDPSALEPHPLEPLFRRPIRQAS